MKKNEMKDRLFDVEEIQIDHLLIQDIVVNNKSNRMSVYLTEGTRFSVYGRKLWKLVLL